MKRHNALIYCRECQSNRAMKTLSRQLWSCLICKTEHFATVAGAIFPATTKKKGGAK